MKGTALPALLLAVVALFCASCGEDSSDGADADGNDILQPDEQDAADPQANDGGEGTPTDGSADDDGGSPETSDPPAGDAPDEETGPGTWTQVTDFGLNPGDLDMYLYAPAGMPAGSALVVALHGCTQDAAGFSELSGWNTLADSFKFYVVYAEQKTSNNINACFNWFEPGDTARGEGEAQSIASMVETMRTTCAVDGGRIFVTGLSAGGFMVPVLLAAYRDVFRGGAIMAGGPYGCAASMTEAFQCMSPGVTRGASEWGDAVRGACPSCAGFPVVSIFHGAGDATVSPSNLTELVKQWTDVAGTDQAADLVETVRGHDHQVHMKDGVPVVESWLVAGMGHGISVDPGTGCDQGGATGAYAEDRDLWSSYYAASFWGLAEGCVDPDPDPDPDGCGGCTDYFCCTEAGCDGYAWVDDAMKCYELGTDGLMRACPCWP